MNNCLPRLRRSFRPVLSVPASSRVNPLPQDHRSLKACAVPVGAGLPAKRPAQATSQLQATRSLVQRPQVLADLLHIGFDRGNFLGP
ncbi:hypothetical protein DM807_03785 [Pseudomonas hunanensis]|nr:hypothetical protein [Pseudomonas hunanensis]